MERRKVVCKDGKYQFLKSKDNGNWHEYGEVKSFKGIADAIQRAEYEIEISPDIVEKIEEYEKRQNEKRRIYFLKNNLHQK